MAANKVTLASIIMLATWVGCAFDPSGPDAENRGDELPNGETVDMFDCSEWTPGPQLVDPCRLGEPIGTLALFANGEYIYDTDASTLTSPDQTVAVLDSVHIDQGAIGLDALLLTSIEVGRDATLRAVGSRALVLASTGNAKLAGTLDVSSGDYGDGAGANAGCLQAVSRNGASSDPANKGASGGAGGTLFDPGAAGAIGAGDGGSPVGGIATGNFAAAVTSIHPGCGGGDGGLGTTATDFGSAGSGGGAILLAAFGRLTIEGSIEAGGAGGAAATNWGGGGGGGSGGFIGVVGDEVLVAGALRAHGGGGAAAASHDIAGTAGEDARSAGASAALGGLGGHEHAGRGGAGATCDQLAEAGEAVVDGDAGGGGGGGLGDVVLIAQTTLQTTPGAYITGADCH